MEALSHLAMGFGVALSWQNLLYCLIGVSVGMLVGVLPGLGPTTGTAVLLPLTFGMPPVSAIIMLAGIYYGAMYGGTITSVLINTPGEAASVVTCLDGYPMAQQGRAGAALGIAGIGSFIGGTLTIIGLVFIGPVIAKTALKFGPPEFFALMVLGMTLVVGLMGKSVLRGTIAAIFGLCLAMIGIDPTSGIARYSFGLIGLTGGIEPVTIAMGMFGIAEIMQSADAGGLKIKLSDIKGFLPKREEWRPSMMAILRGSGLGFLIGLLPGTNSVIPTFLSYSLEKKVAKDPSRFGKGAIEGVAGPETANNAYCGGALIPLFTLGIPSSPVIAILLGAFVMHGLQPGPQLFHSNPELVWGIIASMFIGNAILLIMNLPLAGMWARVALVPTKVLFPIVIAAAVIGAYSINNSLFEVGTMLIFGLIGFMLKKANIPMAPIVLTFILGKSMENSLLMSLTIFRGNYWMFFQRPISGTLLALAILILAASVYAGMKNKKDMLASDIEI